TSKTNNTRMRQEPIILISSTKSLLLPANKFMTARSSKRTRSLMHTIPTQMSAALLIGHGGLDKLEYRTDVPVPEPADDEVLIEVGAAGVNNTDINTRLGWYSKAVDEATNVGGAEGFQDVSDDDAGW